MSEQPIRVLLVDDQQMVRAGFRMLIDSQPDMTVIGEAGDGQQAIDLLATVPADVVLMDVRMPHVDGVEATRHIAPDGPRIIVLTTFDLDEYAFAALQAGASAFLLKDAAPPDLLGAIRSVQAGDAVVAPSTTRRLLDHFVQSAPSTAAPRPPSADRLTETTEREREVLSLIARGLTNSEIAETLFLSEATVKTHISRLLAKTGSRDRVQLVLLALESGA
ncbi:response regulator [Aeromicrobium sp. CTD01-1L150]|uniref:response regulator n=1 Tax=Aeromicrobium sp. CTD01-1L150 TaxID=3341830 RepID=UPI0035BEC469